MELAKPPGRRILLVEDQTPIRVLLSETLEAAGFEVTSCNSAKQALSAFGKFDPDLLIADIDLGSRPNGVELATILRTKAPHLRLLFVTNYPSVRAFERTISPPKHYAFLQKDLLDSKERLLEVLESALTDIRVPQIESSPSQISQIFSLTPNQLEILRSMAAGLTNGEIAQRKGKSMRSVEKMVERIFVGLGLNDDQGSHPRILAVNMYTRTYGYPSKEEIG